MAVSNDKHPEWPEQVGNAIGIVISAVIVMDLLYALLTHFI